MPQDNNQKPPGVFGNMLTSLPILGGIGFGAFQTYTTLRPNMGGLVDSLRTGHINTGKEQIRSVQNIGKNVLDDMVRKSTEAAASVLGHPKQMFYEGITGQDRRRFLKLGTTAFVSAISSPNVGLEKAELNRNIQVIKDLSAKALSPGANTDDYNTAVSFMSGKLRELGQTERAVSITKQLFEPIATGERGSLFELDKLDFTYTPQGQRVNPRLTAPSSAELFSLSKKQKKRIMAGLTSEKPLPSGVKLMVNKGFRMEGQEFAVASISAGKKKFDMILPLNKGTNILVTKNFTRYELPMFRTAQTTSTGGFVSGGQAIYKMMTDTIQELGSGGNLKTVMQNHRERMMNLMSFGTMINSHETAAEKQLRTVRSAYSFPIEGLDITKTRFQKAFPKSQLFDLFKRFPEAEPGGPAQLLRGGVVHTGILSRWFSGTEYMDHTSRLYQSIRDLNWVPSKFAMSQWHLATDQSGKLNLDKAVVRKGGFFNRFKPVNPGKEWSELFNEFGVVTPHQLQLHVIGDEGSKVLEQYGMGKGMGEVIMKDKWKRFLTFERTLPTSVTETGPLANTAIIEKFAGLKKPFFLSPGTFLGVSSTGERMFLEEREGVKYSLIGVESLEGKTRFNIREIQSAPEGFKIQQGIHGGTKGTVRFRENKRVQDIASNIMFGSSSTQLDSVQRTVLKDIDAITSSSNLHKSQGKIMTQITGAMKYFTELKFRKNGSKATGQALEFLNAENPFDWLRNKAGGEAASFEGFVAASASMARVFGINDPKQLGLIFGAVGSQSQFRSEFETIMKNAYGSKKAKNIIEEANKGIFASWSAVVGADFPWQGKAERSRLELRTADLIMSANWKLGDKAVGQAILHDLMHGAAHSDPSKIKTVQALEASFNVATGLVPAPEGDNIQRLKFGMLNPNAVSRESFFKGQGAAIEIPENLQKAAKELGMGSHFYVPGEGAVGKNLILEGQRIEGSGFSRGRDQVLIRQHYRRFIDDSFREISSVIDSQDIERQKEALNNYRSGLSNWLRKARQDVIKAKLGPGSGYVQAGEVADFASMARPIEAGAQEELITRLGKPLAERVMGGDFQTQRQIFISRKEAMSMVRGINWQDMPVSREEFLSGEKGLLGLAWRNPTVMNTSAQMGEIFVHQGVGSREVSSAFIASKYKDVVVGGETVRMNVGMPAGMKLDYDKDMLNLKIFTNRSAVDLIQSSKEDWSKLEQAYQQNVLDRQVLSHVISKRMKSLGMERTASEISDTAFAKGLGATSMATGKDVGKISKIMEELMFALGAKGGDTDKNIMMNMIMSEVEETGTLKVKHNIGMVGLSDLMTEAFHGKAGETLKKGNMPAFLQVVHDKFLGEEVFGGVEYQVGDEKRVLKPQQDLFTYVQKSWNEYLSDDKARAAFAHLRTGRQTGIAGALAAGRAITGQGGISADVAYLGGISSPAEGKYAAFAKLGIGEANAEAIVEGAKKAYQTVGRKIPGPVMLGLLGSAAALAVVGGPGYADEPLTPEGTSVDPRILDSIKRGTILSSANASQQPNVSPNDMRPSGGGPEVDGNLIAPSAYVVKETNSVNINMRDRDLSGVDYDQMMSDLRRRLPSANLNARISDSRRPLSPNDKYRDEI